MSRGRGTPAGRADAGARLAGPGSVRRSLRPANLVDPTAWPAGMRANRVPGAAPPGRAAALGESRGLPARSLGLQHPRRSARRPRGPPPAARALPGAASGARKCPRALRSQAGGPLCRARPLRVAGLRSQRVWCLLVALVRRPTGLIPDAHLGRRPARRWEPKTVRLRLMSVPAGIARRTVRPARQGRPPPSQPPADRAQTPEPIAPSTYICPLPTATTQDPLGPRKARPPRDDTRHTATPNQHHPTHSTCDAATHPLLSQTTEDRRQRQLTAPISFRGVNGHPIG